MSRVSAGRRAALEVLEAVERGRRLDRALADARGSVPERERPFLHELTYGVIRLRGRLDHLLDHHLRDGIASVPTRVLQILRFGAYQLLHLDGIPAYAAVSQSVEQVREAVGKGLAGLVNGVLRSVQRAGEDPALFPGFEEDPAGHLSTWGSHPPWLVERWLRRWSPGEVRALVESDNEIPPIYLRPVGVDPEAAVRRLAAEGIEAREVGGGTGCVRLPIGTDPARALGVVPAVVQDPGAALAVAYAAPDPGSRVADLCAAPGGKALALVPAASYVLAADRSGPRLRLVRENADRLGVGPDRLGTVEARAEEPPVASADLVLVDAPCTGTGTLRRHPDARWRTDPDGPRRMAAVQARILDGASSAVRPGGVLVYSTCTLEPEENEETVLAFLDRHPTYRVDPGECVPPPLLDRRGFLRVLPQETGFDGAFAARL
ncbi:MAG TPA: transcription antitermination factor NusB, partial [Longimicrobiales bacterium]|nr:transcription antitermination factor NusB [Longimicrobiales bacterium]